MTIKIRYESHIMQFDIFVFFQSFNMRTYLGEIV